MSGRMCIVDQARLEYLKRLGVEFKKIRSIWLIGSRANGSYSLESDWDFLVMADQETLESIRSRSDLHDARVDLLVVYDGDNFQSAFERPKQGSLSDWRWELIDEATARYQGAKWASDEVGVVAVSQVAKRVFPEGV